MAYYENLDEWYELNQLELLPWWWIVEVALVDFDEDALELLDEGNQT